MGDPTVVHSLLKTRMLASLIVTCCSVVEVLALVGLTKKRFGHYAILKILSLRSPNQIQAVPKYFF